MTTIRALLLLGGTLLLAGCDINGGGLDYPGASLYQAPDEGFHLFYLSPPWRTATADEGILLKLVVDAYGELTPGDDQVSHVLELMYGQSSTPEEEASRIRQVVVAAGRQSKARPAVLLSLAGDAGWEFFSSQDGPAGRNYFRDCFYSDAAGRVVHLSLSGAFSMDEQDVEDLVRSFAASAGTP